MRHPLRSLLGSTAAAALALAPCQAYAVLTPAHHAQPAPIATTFSPPSFAGCDFNVPTTFANTWYIDPVNGQTQNVMTTAGISLDPTVTPHQGDKAHPWKDINAVAISKFNVVVGVTGYPAALFQSPQGTNGPIHGGDDILLESGTAAQYGVVRIGDSGIAFNATGAFLTIQPDVGANVTFASLAIGSFSNIHVSGVNLQSTGKFPLLYVSPGWGKNIALDSMNISTTDAATAQAWTQAQWAAASNGVSFKPGPCASLANSHIFNVATGVGFQGGTQINFESNEIDHVSRDAIDLCGLDERVSGNSIHDFPNGGKGDHIDAIQGVICVSKIPVDHRIDVSGNTILWQVDPNLPFPTGSLVNGAIDWGGCCWEDMQANNNKISWPNWVHGISLDHTTNGMVENNTLAGGYIVTNGGDVNVMIKNNLVSGLDCKGRDQAGVQMENNILYKGGNGINIVCYGGAALKLPGASGTYLGNNKIDMGGVLSEITAFDLRNFVYKFVLLPTAPARRFGAPVDFSPAVDSLGNPMNSPSDVGAIQFQAKP
jgi:hypothetical protein